MALDHFIPQVYLKNFNTNHGIDLFWGVNKVNQKVFQTKSKDICRLANFNTNSWFNEPRLIEEFLKTIEPNVNKAIDQIVHDEIDDNTIYIISGLISYILTCSPCAVRQSMSVVQRNTDEFIRAEERVGNLPSYKENGNVYKLSELINNGSVKISIDKEFPHAIGISNVMRTLNRLGNWPWEILINNTKDSFITSDYPIGIIRRRYPMVADKIFTLTPKIAIKIYADPRKDGQENKICFDNFRFTYTKIGRTDVKYINKLLIKTAEKFIYMKDRDETIIKLVKELRNYHVEQNTYKAPSNNGYYIINIQEIVKKKLK